MNILVQNVFFFGFLFVGSDSKIKLAEDEVRACKWVSVEDFDKYLLFDEQIKDTTEKIKEIFGIEVI